jgi:hypothetical protein
LIGKHGGNRRAILDRGPTRARRERHGVDRCGAFAAGEDMEERLDEEPVNDKNDSPKGVSTGELSDDRSMNVDLASGE